MHRLPYHECYPNGRNAARDPECVTAGINSYPTWLINGERYNAILSPQDLARHSRFTGTPETAGSSGARQ